MAELLNSDGSSIHPRRRRPRASARVSCDDAPSPDSGDKTPVRASAGDETPGRGKKISKRTAGIDEPTQTHIQLTESSTPSSTRLRAPATIITCVAMSLRANHFHSLLQNEATPT